MKLVKPDPQVWWLCKTSLTFENNFTVSPGPIDWGGNGYFPVECPNLLKELAEDMDWIGQLENFDETIQLFQQTLGIPIKSRATNPTRKKHVLLKTSDLTDHEVKTIKQGLQLDYQLYNFSKGCFPAMNSSGKGR